MLIMHPYDIADVVLFEWLHLDRKIVDLMAFRAFPLSDEELFDKYIHAGKEAYAAASMMPGYGKCGGFRQRLWRWESLEREVLARGYTPLALGSFEKEPEQLVPLVSQAPDPGETLTLFAPDMCRELNGYRPKEHLIYPGRVRDQPKAF